MAKEPGSIGVIGVVMPAGLRQQVDPVRTARTHDTHYPGPGPVTVRPESDPHHATEA
jgi:hypothetical protein